MPDSALVTTRQWRCERRERGCRQVGDALDCGGDALEVIYGVLSHNRAREASLTKNWHMVRGAACEIIHPCKAS
jgi:hypothetical protein